MDTCSLVIIIALFVVGLGLTIGGLVGAVVVSRRDLGSAEQRVAEMERLREKHRPETAALRADLDARRTAEADRLGRTLTVEERERWNASDEVEMNALRAQHEAEFAASGLVRPTNGNIAQLAQHESQWVVGRLVDANRGNLWMLGAGIVLQTVASIWSLF